MTILEALPNTISHLYLNRVFNFVKVCYVSPFLQREFSPRGFIHSNLNHQGDADDVVQKLKSMTTYLKTLALRGSPRFKHGKALIPLFGTQMIWRIAC